jgi:streptogramin lyase
MYNRSIKGTNDWKKYEIILDVPLESSKLNYGLLINGTGKVWFDQLNIEIIGDIDSKISNTDLPDKPTNIDFEE